MIGVIIGGIKGPGGDGIGNERDAIESAVGADSRLLRESERTHVGGHVKGRDGMGVGDTEGGRDMRAIWVVPRRLLWGAEKMEWVGRRHLYARRQKRSLTRLTGCYLSGEAGEPGRAVVETMIADTCWRLICRGRSPPLNGRRSI